MTKKEVFFCGPDGSGKTTLALITSSYLSTRGLSSLVIWLRGSHLLASLILKSMASLGIAKGKCNPYYNVCLPGKAKKIWIHIEFWSFIIYFCIYLIISKIFDIVLFERSPIDFVVWILTTLEDTRYLNSIYSKFLLIWVKKSNTICINAKIAILLQRTDVPRHFLLRETIMYRVLSAYFVDKELDTSSCSPVACSAKLIYLLSREERRKNIAIGR